MLLYFFIDFAVVGHYQQQSQGSLLLTQLEGYGDSYGDAFCDVHVYLALTVCCLSGFDFVAFLPNPY